MVDTCLQLLLLFCLIMDNDIVISICPTLTMCPMKFHNELLCKMSTPIQEDGFKKIYSYPI